MKDMSEESLRRGAIDVGADEALNRVQFCLGELFKTKEARFEQEMFADAPLTYEELLGALLSAEHELKLVTAVSEVDDDDG